MRRKHSSTAENRFHSYIWITTTYIEDPYYGNKREGTVGPIERGVREEVGKKMLRIKRI